MQNKKNKRNTRIVFNLPILSNLNPFYTRYRVLPHYKTNRITKNEIACKMHAMKPRTIL